MSLSSASSVGSVGCGASCDETAHHTKRRKLEDSQHEPVSPTAPDPLREEGQDTVTAQVGCPYMTCLPSTDGSGTLTIHAVIYRLLSGLIWLTARREQPLGTIRGAHATHVSNHLLVRASL